MYLGIGSTTAIFSFVQNALLSPFPYRDADRLVTVRIHDSNQGEPGGREHYSKAEFFKVQKENHVFDGVIGEEGSREAYVHGGGTEIILAGRITPGTFQFLGVNSLIGRPLILDDFRHGAAPAFVMSYKTCLNRFGGDPNILNKTFSFGGKQHMLVGVMPPRFALSNREFWLPVEDFTDLRFRDDFFLIARLKSGITKQQVAADLKIIFERLARTSPGDFPVKFTVEVMSLADQGAERLKFMLTVMFEAAGLLLLIGCGNVANLLLARASTREKDMAGRAVLGASPWRLARQVMTESLLPALMGAAGLPARLGGHQSDSTPISY